MLNADNKLVHVDYFEAHVHNFQSLLFGQSLVFRFWKQFHFVLLSDIVHLVLIFTFVLYYFVKLRLLLIHDGFSHLVCKVHEVGGVRASYLGWLEVGFVHTLLTVLKVKTEIVILELSIEVFHNFFDVLYFFKGCQRSRC